LESSQNDVQPNVVEMSAPPKAMVADNQVVAKATDLSLDGTANETGEGETTSKRTITPTIAYYTPDNGNSFQIGVCSEVLSSGLGPLIENCGAPLDCCSQYNCKYGNQRKLITSVVEYVHAVDRTQPLDTTQNFCFAPWYDAPGSGRRRRSMGLFEYWSHGGGLSPSSMNAVVENLRNVEDTRISKIAQQMVLTEELTNAINEQESEIDLLKDSLCIANTETVNQLKLSELRISYGNLASRIEDNIRVCSQNNVLTAVHYRLMSEACRHINPTKRDACSHPEVLEAFGCRVRTNFLFCNASPTACDLLGSFTQGVSERNMHRQKSIKFSNLLTDRKLRAQESSREAFHGTKISFGNDPRELVAETLNDVMPERSFI
jgi:hypothetical protein